ncbi:MAG: 2'-5' RNA ligase family protein [bacterium]|nr:2'-5' RNA ligase family protein [bacterium]
MSQKTHQTAIVLSPPEEMWGPIQAIRKVHDRNVRRWMPHVTLVYPFRPRDGFEDLLDAFSVACREVAPFEVRLANFRSFRHGNRGFTMWLAPEPPENLNTLQTALWEVVPDCDEVRRHSGEFTPHMSVGQARREGAMLKVLTDLDVEWEPIVFQAEAVNLIWRNDPPDDVFRVAYSVCLGTGEIVPG